MEKPIELRDFFAGCALAGYSANENGSLAGDVRGAFKVADMMMLAREESTAQDDTKPPAEPEDA